MRRRAPGLDRQRGAVAIAFAVLATVWLGFMAMAIDLAMAFNRHAELQTLADNAALAGAVKLNGSAGGVTDAVDQARRRANPLLYQSNTDAWLPDDAFRFAADPDAPESAWKTKAAALAQPAGLLFLRVRTDVIQSNSGSQYNLVRTSFIRLLLPQLATVFVSTESVAGKLASAPNAVMLFR